MPDRRTKLLRPLAEIGQEIREAESLASDASLSCLTELRRSGLGGDRDWVAAQNGLSADGVGARRERLFAAAHFWKVPDEQDDYRSDDSDNDQFDPAWNSHGILHLGLGVLSEPCVAGEMFALIAASLGDSRVPDIFYVTNRHTCRVRRELEDQFDRIPFYVGAVFEYLNTAANHSRIGLFLEMDYFQRRLHHLT